MKQKHLTTKQVEQYCQTGYLGPDERTHLAMCPGCQSLVSDLRLIGRLLQEEKPEQDKSHLSIDELDAYHNEALGFGRMKEVEQHLGGCNHCLARLMQLRALDNKLEYQSPTPHMVSAALKQFHSKQKIQKLGRLIIQTMKESGALILTLDPAVISMPEDRYLSLKKDVGQRNKTPDGVIARDELGSDMRYSLASEDMSVAASRFEPLSTKRGESVKIVSDTFHIDISVAEEGGVYLLNAILQSVQKEKPTSNIRIYIFPEDDLVTEALTDEQGAAVLQIPSGSSILQIDTDPPLQLEISTK